jgi:hypothetical protein
MRQQEINKQYTLEAKKIEQLKVLEAQKAEMLEKADITTALIEKVPRSILLAELINRMPQQLTLTELKLVGKRIKETPPATAPGKTPPRSLAGTPAPTGKPGAAPMAKVADGKATIPVEKPKPPKFDFTVALVGLSQADADVADYQASLQQCPLLEKVDLMYSGEVIINDISLRKFRIEVTIKPTADARQILPLHVPRLASHLSSPAQGRPSAANSLLENAGINSPKSPASGKKAGANQPSKSTTPRKGVAGVPDK